MADLRTTYLGLELASPLVPAASPLSRSLDAIRRMEDAGAGAVVLYSLFEEQIAEGKRPAEVEIRPYLPGPTEFRATPDEYVEHVRRAKAAVGIPVVGSLNGASSGGWVRYARAIEEAGADALELNVYHLPTDPLVLGEEVEYGLLELVTEVRRSLRIPLAVKLGPHFTSLPNMAHRLSLVGADGLVLFNRLQEPRVGLGPPTGTGGVLSPPEDGQAHLLAAGWIALLHGRVALDLAASGGLRTAEHVLDVIAAGASVAMLASALILEGIDWLRRLQDALHRLLDEQGHASLAEVRGRASHALGSGQAAVQRAAYLRVAGVTHPARVPWQLVRGF